MRIAEFLITRNHGWTFDEPASHDAINTLTRQSRVPLPEDYLLFLRGCNGGEGFLDKDDFPGYLQIWPAEVVIQFNKEYGIPEYAPGFFGFGSSGGGEFLAFDTRQAGSFPVVCIPFVSLKASDALTVAGSLSELLSRVVPR